MWAFFSSAAFVIIAAGTFLAWRALVTKSGKSGPWLAFGIAPIVTLAITYVVAAFQHLPKFFGSVAFFRTPAAITDYIFSAVYLFLRSGHLTFSIFGVLNFMVALDMLAFLVAWAGFVVLALTEWPNAVTRSASGPSVASTPAPTTPRGVPPRNAAPVRTATYNPPAPPTGVPGGVDMRRRLYCPWCGEHIPGNRALGHDCGPKDRPEVMCRFCGQAFLEGTTSCATCDA